MREANVNGGQFLSKRLVRLGWRILALILVQFFVSPATSETGLSRTAPLPPLDEAATASQRQTLH